MDPHYEQFGLMSCTDVQYLKRHMRMASEQVKVLSISIDELVLRHNLARYQLPENSHLRSKDIPENSVLGQGQFQSKTFLYNYRLRLIVAEGTRTRFNAYAKACSFRIQQLANTNHN